MPPQPSWFTISTSDSMGRLHIRGDWAGGRFWDDTHPYDINVEAEGLRIDTQKSIDAKSIDAFVRQFGALNAATTDETISLRSAVVADFDLSVISRRGVCRLKFKLRHGNSNQWSVEFVFDTVLENVVVECGTQEVEDDGRHG